MAETAKRHLNSGEQPDLYFYHDDSKCEIDLIDLTRPGEPKAVEIKSSRVYHDKHARHLKAVCNELGIGQGGRFVVSRVGSSYKTDNCRVVAAADWLGGKMLGSW